MPVAAMESCEGAYETLRSKSSIHMRVFGNINIIIVVYKIMFGHLPKNQSSCYNQKQRNHNPQTIRTHVSIFSSYSQFPLFTTVHL